MRAFRAFYERYKRIIESLIYPAALIVLPLLNHDQGVDISDSTYSLGNYMFSDRLSGMWVVSTYLSNKIGALILNLPGAHKLSTVNIYTGLILAAVALVVYFGIKEELGGAYAFIGEFAAICFCWIPTGILYNYLSYLFLVLGALLLYKGISEKRNLLLLFAGFVLGINVSVRVPNITQMALILVLWVRAFVYKENVVKKTFICIGGYMLGIAVYITSIIVEYGVNGLSEMITGLRGITSTDSTYTPMSMITGTITDYIRSFKWVAVILVVTAFGMLVFAAINKVNMPAGSPAEGKKHKAVYAAAMTVYIAVIMVMIRFFWGRGMFSFRYYEDYTSMYEWGMIFLYLSIAADILVIVNVIQAQKGGRENNSVRGLGRSRYDERHLLLALISLVVIVIAPLGSNNHTYQNLNNMFLVAPLTVKVIYDFILLGKTKLKGYIIKPVSVMLSVLLIVIVVQSYGFHLNFVFRDGMRGEKRECRITAVDSLNGMYTNSQNALELEKICGIIADGSPDELLLYGNCPGLTYITAVPSAMTSSWSDLDSNPLSMIEDDLENIGERLEKTKDEYRLMAIIGSEDSDSELYRIKKGKILEFLEGHDFQVTMKDEAFTIYEITE